jgi:uncharacterized membrane protein
MSGDFRKRGYECQKLQPDSRARFSKDAIGFLHRGLHRVEHNQIVEAIRRAERKSSGEIRVFVTHKAVADPVAAAKHHFQRLGMTKTRQRNAVLFFIAPRSQNFEVAGNVAIHEGCGDDFWQSLVEDLSTHFQMSEFTAGILHAIDRAGELLAEHFPREPDDTNELPDRAEDD